MFSRLKKTFQIKGVWLKSQNEL